MLLTANYSSYLNVTSEHEISKINIEQEQKTKGIFWRKLLIYLQIRPHVRHYMSLSVQKK